MITEKQVVAAEVQAADAERVRVEAQNALIAAPHSQLSAIKVAEASQEAAQSAANAREMRAAFEEQRAAALAAADRGALEKAAASQIAAAAKELESARKALVARAEAAQQVLVELIDAAFTYNSAVSTSSASLIAAGLDMRTGHQASTGGEQRVYGPVVRIKGRQYQQADAGAAAVWVVNRVSQARLPHLHPAAGPLRFFSGVMGVEEQAEGLFAGLSTPEKVEYRPIRWPHRVDLNAPTAKSG